MPAGLGGGGAVAFTFETALGTYLPPTTAGTIWIPIISENLHYVEDKYYSEAIRQQTIDNDVKSSYYHVEGDIVAEVDTNWLPYMLYCSRHLITKTGAADPFKYDFIPSSAGSTSTASSGAVARTASITVTRNGIGFGYAGCNVNNWEFTIENGVLRVTMGILGVSETTPGGLGTPAWLAPELFGADAHSVFVAASGVSPTFGAASTDFNGFTATFNYNAAAQNRIVANRGASYVSFGKTEAGYTTELDFISKTEYDNFKAATTRAVRLESVRPSGSTFATATEAVQITFNRSAYDSYDVGLGGIGDLIMAATTGHGLAQTGGNPYQISVMSAIAIT
jgi:Phage tail tube protein